VEYQPQLPLIGAIARRSARPGAESDWRIDEPTRRVGRRGLAAARAALNRSTAFEDRNAAAA
jgi:hypothetical protein